MGTLHSEQLVLDVVAPSAASGEEVVSTEPVVRSQTYLSLAAIRDAAYARHRSGARAIASLAFAALQEGRITREEHALLFSGAKDEPPVKPGTPPMPLVTSPDTEDPEERQLDWAERAAGEDVRRP